MGFLAFAISVALVAFGAGVLGLTLHARLPEKHSPDKSAGMIGAMTGLLSLLLALVLGTFAGSAYTLYATQKSELETLGARIMQLELGARSLSGRRRSPAAKPCARRSARPTRKSGAIRQGRRRTSDVKSIFAGTRTLEQYLLSLSPKSDGQKQALSMANSAATDINKTRLLMGLQLASGIPVADADDRHLLVASDVLRLRVGVARQQDRGCERWGSGRSPSPAQFS